MEDLVCLALNNSKQESTERIRRSIKYNRSEGSMQNYQSLKDNDRLDGIHILQYSEQGNVCRMLFSVFFPRYIQNYYNQSVCSSNIFWNYGIDRVLNKEL